MLALVLVAISVGLSNFAGAIGIGLSGVDNRLRLRVGLLFAVFEGGMPALGLLIGHHVASSLGSAAKPIGGGLLGATGIYVIVSGLIATRSAEQRPDEAGADGHATNSTSTGRLLVSSFALSIDNLVVGFALGAYHVNIAVGVVVIAAVSVALSLIGLELGVRLGKRIERFGDLIGGAVLILVGAAIGAGII